MLSIGKVNYIKAVVTVLVIAAFFIDKYIRIICKGEDIGGKTIF